MTALIPVWTTPSDAFSTPLMGSGALRVQATVQAIVYTDASPSVIVFFDHPPAVVSSLTINGAELSRALWTRDGAMLTIDASSYQGSITVVVTVVETITYTKLTGGLPPGLRLLEDGNIVGILGFCEQEKFVFTVRASSIGGARDRTFSLTVEPSSVSKYSFTNLNPTVDYELGIDYVEMASLRLAQYYEYIFRIQSLDGSSPEIEIKEGDRLPHPFSGLPDGLLLFQGGISGNINPQARVGRYLIEVGFKGQDDNTAILEFIVSSELYIDTSAVRQMITWSTPEGLLGEIFEGYPSRFSVKASSAGNISYSLSPSSRPLPPGLTLDSIAGDIRGKPIHVYSDTVFEFSIRASVGSLFSDQKNSILVKNRYNKANTSIVTMRPRALIKQELEYRDLIPVETLYRPQDASFGLASVPSIYIVGGLSGNDLSPAFVPEGSGVIEDGYQGSVDLRWGEHDFAVVRDRDGEIVSEVIFRRVIDPESKSGGFEFGTDAVIEKRVLWPQSKTNPRYIYPQTLRNLRRDLVKDIGLSADGELKTLLGTSGVEPLPEWMTSPQTKGGPPLGYIAVLEIAHLLPNTAADIVKILNQDSSLPPAGRGVRFDRYHLLGTQNILMTTFDSDSFKIDGGATTFDRVGLKGRWRGYFDTLILPPHK